MGLRLVCKASPHSQTQGPTLLKAFNVSQWRLDGACWLHNGSTVQAYMTPFVSPKELVRQEGHCQYSASMCCTVYLQQGLGHLLVCDDCCQALL